MVSYVNKVIVVISKWSARTANLRCFEICNDLVDLGFVICDGRIGGHKIVSHPMMKRFIGADFNCGHGTNPIVKPVYVRKLLRVLKDYKIYLCEVSK